MAGLTVVKFVGVRIIAACILTGFWVIPWIDRSQSYIGKEEIRSEEDIIIDIIWVERIRFIIALN